MFAADIECSKIKDYGGIRYDAVAIFRNGRRRSRRNVVYFRSNRGKTEVGALAVWVFKIFGTMAVHMNLILHSVCLMFVGLLTGSLAPEVMAGAVASPGDGRVRANLQCVGCARPIGERDLLRHLRSRVVAWRVVARNFGQRGGDFERRWGRLNLAAQDAVDADYRAKRADDRRTGRAHYSEFTALSKARSGRLRLATEISRRLAADGYSGGLPGDGCRIDDADSLRLRACAFRLALDLQGLAGQRAYAMHAAVPAAMSADFGIYLQRDRQFESALLVLETAQGRARRDGEAGEALRSAQHLANVQADLNHPAIAEATYEQVLRQRRTSSPRDRDDHWIDLSTTLNNLHTVLIDQAKSERAEETLREALEIRLGLAVASPEIYLVNVGVSLSNFATLFAAQGKHAEAVSALELAAAVYRHLLPRRPALLGQDLGGILGRLADYYRIVNKAAQAEAAVLAAAYVYRDLIHDDGPYHFDRAKALREYGGLRLAAGDSASAVHALEAAVAGFRFLESRQPGKFKAPLADALGLLGMALHRMERATEAQAVTVEALGLRQTSIR